MTKLQKLFDLIGSVAFTIGNKNNFFSIVINNEYPPRQQPKRNRKSRK